VTLFSPVGIFCSLAPTSIRSCKIKVPREQNRAVKSARDMRDSSEEDESKKAEERRRRMMMMSVAMTSLVPMVVVT